MTRPVATILAALLLISSSPAWAKDDKPGPTPPGQSHVAPGQPPSPPVPPGQAKEPPGQAKDHEPPGQAKKPGEGVAPGGSGVALSPDEIRVALERRDALPLAEIVAIAESRRNARMINAELVEVDGFLLYLLTMLDETGHSWRDYYYARTGNPVTIR
jgi:hypothetical protein